MGAEPPRKASSHPLPVGVRPAMGRMSNALTPEAETRWILKAVFANLFFQ